MAVAIELYSHRLAHYLQNGTSEHTYKKDVSNLCSDHTTEITELFYKPELYIYVLLDT